MNSAIMAVDMHAHVQYTRYMLHVLFTVVLLINQAALDHMYVLYTKSLSLSLSFSFGSSILVDSQTTAIDQLAFNPQCFAVYEEPSLPPGQWNNVCTCVIIY